MLIKKRSNGFTLIELLVVISIIALLLSILMPALSKVKMQAERTVCKSNLKQMHLVASLYAEDNRSFFPRKTINHNADTYVYFTSDYPSSDARYLWDGYMPGFKLVQVGEVNEEDFAPKVMYCPSLNKTSLGFERSWPTDAMFGGNLFMIGYDSFNIGDLKELSGLSWESKVPIPEKNLVAGYIPLFGDLIIYNYDLSQPVFRIANHFKTGAAEFVFDTGSANDQPDGANNVHVDGSVEWYDYQDEMEPFYGFPSYMQRSYWGMTRGRVARAGGQIGI